MSKQDFGIPLGNPAAAAFTPLVMVAGVNSIRGQAARDLFLERLGLYSNGGLAGLVNDVRVMKQSVVASDAGFPVEMLSATAFDDEALSLGLGIEGATFVDVDYTPPAAEVGQVLSGMVGTAPLPDGVTPQDDDLDAFQWIFGLGEFVAGGAGPWQLSALALRDVYLGRIVIVGGAADTLESIQVAKAEQLSGDGSILLSAFSAQATDTDGLTIGKVMKAGETLLIKGQAAAAGSIRAGVYLLDMDELLEG